MYCKTYSASLEGLDARQVEVELDVSKGLPAFGIVGLADKSINEARDRVSVAMKASGFPLPPKRILVNLAPANLKKEGPQLDLAIAAALLVAFAYSKVDAAVLESFCFLSELSLEGKSKSVLGILPLALSAAQSKKAKYLVINKDNADEASLVTLQEDNDLEIFLINDLKELKTLIEAVWLFERELDPDKKKLYAHALDDFRAPQINLEKIFTKEKQKDKKDFKEVIGQAQAKRGLEIAAAGGHHCLMIGPPGCGKSMLASRFATLLPELSFTEALEATKIYSVSGLLNGSLVTESPFRAPHHSATAAALVGGGSPPKPGEASLAHNGVLFLDELTEFNRFIIDQFRQVLENKEITLSRARQTYNYPANFILIAACNPCPCGYLGDTAKECSCSPAQIARYITRLSGPFLDRVDLHIQLSRLDKDEIYALGDTERHETNRSTQEIKASIVKAKDFRKQRQREPTQNELYLDQETKDFIHEAATNLSLSARSHQKVIKVARTIADLAESEMIKLEHVAEALQFRSLNWDDYLQNSYSKDNNCFKAPNLVHP